MVDTHLAFAGHHGVPVPHEFLRHPGQSDRLAIFLPGFGYSCDMPLFYYAEQLLLGRGADLLRLQPAYAAEPGFRLLAEDQKVARLVGDAAPAIRAAMSERPYADIVVVAKSLGTLTLAHLLLDGVLPPTARLIWAPPLLHREAVARAISAHRGPNLIAIGTLDQDYDPATLARFTALPNLELMVVDGGDHSLDIPDDVGASIAALSTVLTRIASFIGDRAP